MPQLSTVLRTVLGLAFVTFGVNYFIPFLPQPSSLPPEVITFMVPFIGAKYMGLIKAIPDELYEASALVGAGPAMNLWRITLPLIAKPMAPLLVASFATNFNNLTLIALWNPGTGIANPNPAGSWWLDLGVVADPNSPQVDPVKTPVGPVFLEHKAVQSIAVFDPKLPRYVGTFPFPSP